MHDDLLRGTYTMDTRYRDATPKADSVPTTVDGMPTAGEDDGDARDPVIEELRRAGFEAWMLPELARKFRALSEQDHADRWIAPQSRTIDPEAQYKRGMEELSANLAKTREHAKVMQDDIERLAIAIMEEHGGPSYEGGAIDNAIHMLRDMRSERIAAVRAMEDAQARAEYAERRISHARDIAHAAVDVALGF